MKPRALALMTTMALATFATPAQPPTQSGLKLSMKLSLNLLQAARLTPDGMLKANPPASSRMSMALPAESATGLDGKARGVVRPVNEATLSARMTGFIRSMPLKEGQSFKKGQVLVEFDCERQVAESKAAGATVNVQQRTVETNQELDKFASIGKNDLLISVSQLDKANAESQALNSALRHCKLLAPFDGRVVTRMARAYEAVNVSQPLIKVIDVEHLELELIVPSAWLKWLNVGTGFSFLVDETEAKLTGRITQVVPNVDPVSKTVRLTGSIATDSPRGQTKVWPGMSGSATFKPLAQLEGTRHGPHHTP